jgi:hypothetical protein
MNRFRADAYRRVIHTLMDLGPAKLWPPEQACIRDAADAMLFCTDRGGDVAARVALSAAVVLVDELIEAERWTPERAHRLLDEIYACGPWDSLAAPIAA